MKIDVENSFVKLGHTNNLPRGDNLTTGRWQCIRFGGVINNQYYKEYRKLGGNKNKEEYVTDLNIFIYHTLDLFVYSEKSVHNTRKKAIEAVINESDITLKEYNLIYKSVDNVTAYTGIE
tara:strand:- start:35 stop:394 length:360 start_codon:yes stop_codon:yes gene_type:complete